MKDTTKARLSVLAAMLIFGTVGIFRRYIPLSSGLIAMARGLLGTVFLLLAAALRRRRMAWETLRPKAALLILSGALIGFNWILLFEAYQKTTVATATLCYYMSPVFVMLASPLLLGEKLTGKKALCALMAVIGMLPVSGVLTDGGGLQGLPGILLGLGAGLLYASVVILNKKLSDLPAYDKTVVQLGSAAVVMVPYLLLTEDPSAIVLTPLPVILLLVMGVVHTGVAYALYFSSFSRLSAQGVALLGYVDPVAAVLLSAFLLREPMTLGQGIGALLILSSAVLAEVELPLTKRKRSDP